MATEQWFQTRKINAAIQIGKENRISDAPEKDVITKTRHKNDHIDSPWNRDHWKSYNHSASSGKRTLLNNKQYLASEQRFIGLQERKNVNRPFEKSTGYKSTLPKQKGDCLKRKEANESSLQKINFIYGLKQFNNWAKARAMELAVETSADLSFTAMDLGCGKGADLKKWAHLHPRHLYLVEKQEQDLEECKKRYSEICTRWNGLFNATFLERDYTNVDVILPEEVDIVSCQFLLQRAFNTKKEALQFSKNISHALKPGGYFVSSLLNADKLKECAKSSRNKMEFGNSLFRVKLEQQLCENNPEYGMKMTFQVCNDSYDENLVQIKTLVSVMKRNNMNLIWRTSFRDLYNAAPECNNGSRNSLLKAMNITKGGQLHLSHKELDTADLFDAVLFKKMSSLEVEKQ